MPAPDASGLIGLLQQVGGWEGFEVAGVTTDATPAPDVHGVPAPRLIIELQPAADHVKRCSQCGAPVSRVHETTIRRVRDLAVMEWDTWLLVPRARVECPRCGPTVEAVPWLDKYARMTTRLAAKIAGLAQVLPLKHVAAWFRVGWDTVKQIDQRALQRRLGRMEDHLDGLTQLAVDEFAIEKGHRYVTIVLDVVTKRVVWLVRGRGDDALASFFTALGPTRCAQITAVTCDLWGPYTTQVQRFCPQAALVYDAFHLIARYGHEVVDRVRVDETNALARAAGAGAVREARRVIKGTRWLLLKNAAGLRRDERVRLRDLLAANRALFIVYVLKDDFKQLWQYRAEHAARRWWTQWRRRARASRLVPLQRFVTMLDRHLHGILNHCRHPLSTGVLEGCNNKIKVLKRMAYGYRDDAYFFLKIRAAFPGIPG